MMDPDLVPDHGDLGILDLALRLQWSSVAERADQAPEEIASTDQDGLNVLHWACCNPPPLAWFQSILSHSQPVKIAACVRDSNGMTPLLCACACQAPVDMITALVQACPDALAITDNDDWTALHYICCRAKTGENALEHALAKAQVFLQLCPALALQRDAFGRTALGVLCNLFEVELRCSYLFRATQTNNLTELWQLATVLVRQQHALPDNADAEPDILSTILHDVVSFPNVPLELVMFAACQDPEMALVQDGAGNTPLHIAVHNQNLPMIDFLARNHPDAASLRNNDGAVPLSLAAASFESWNDVLHSLLCADATAVRFLETDELHYPALLSRINDDPSIVFDILRSTPTLMGYYYNNGW